MNAAHLVALSGTDWLVWRAAMLRATGFPADGLHRLSTPDCAGVADAHLAGDLPADTFLAAFSAAQADAGTWARETAADPLLREAVTWQNRSALVALDGLLTTGPEGRRERKKRRERERTLARYWQRYCAKAETIGFFGPVCWIEIDPDAEAITAKPGAGLVRNRQVYLEHWALAALADHVTADPAARRWCIPALQPHLTLRGTEVLDPARPPTRLSRAEAAVLARCDGRTPAVRIAADCVADSDSGLHSAEDVHLLLDRLARLGPLRYGIDIPVTLDGEESLRRSLNRIGDEPVRAGAVAQLDRLCAARDAVAAAAGDPAALAVALADLDSVFGEVTGQPAARKPGEMYAGRGICWEETTRDLDLVVGGPLLSAVAEPLAVLLTAARWVTHRMVVAYSAALGRIFDELCAESGTTEVPLSQLWFLGQALFYGTAPRPADDVAAELSRRWTRLFGLADLPADTRSVTARAADLLPVATELFRADGPGWSAARLHSPDLQVVAPDVAAINRGEFTVVLGELHVAWATNTCGAFVGAHPDPDALRAALTNDLGRGRLRPLLPLGWPRYTSRLSFALEDPTDAQLGFAPAPGADPDRLVPITSCVVRRVGEALVAVDPGGRSWPLAEVFDRPLAEVSVEAFKVVERGAHSPRLTVDRLVVARESWRTTVGECPLSRVVGDAERFLTGRRWRAELGLPERMFVKIATETKPTYVDLASPLLVTSLATMLRSARLAHGPDTGLAMSESLPDPDQSWVPDGAGRRYVSELRFQIVDPLPVPEVEA